MDLWRNWPSRGYYNFGRFDVRWRIKMFECISESTDSLTTDVQFSSKRLKRWCMYPKLRQKNRGT